jgi:hypothetical protein
VGQVGVVWLCCIEKGDEKIKKLSYEVQGETGLL